ELQPGDRIADPTQPRQSLLRRRLRQHPRTDLPPQFSELLDRLPVEHPASQPRGAGGLHYGAVTAPAERAELAEIHEPSACRYPERAGERPADARPVSVGD